MAPSGSSSAPVESRWSKWSKSAFDKSIVVSDWAAGYANAASAKAGGERFWPKSNDMVEEIEKCARILRTFTVEGLETQQKEEEAEVVVDAKGNKVKKRRKVLKKIPPRAIQKAKGIVIYSAMRSGIAPFGGTGGTGLVLARLPDGSWSAPASVSPNNLSVGLLLGLDIFDVVLLLNSDKAMESFYSHKVTLGAETAVAAGPVGSGASMESGWERAPVYSYVKSRGLYAGIEAIAQVFLSRFDENERFYYWPGIKGEDILKGKVKIPPSVFPLHNALSDAESGRAQGGKLERTVYDIVKVPKSDLMARLSSPNSGDGAPDGEDMLQDGERLRLPPTPEELDALEAAGIPDEEDIRLAQKEREDVYKLPPPPMHSKVKMYWDQHPNKRALRPTHQLTLGGPSGARARARPDGAPHTASLPLSPWEVPLPMSPPSGVGGPDGVPPAYQDNGFQDDDDQGDGPTQYALDAKKDTEKEVHILPPPTRKVVTRKPVRKAADAGLASAAVIPREEESAEKARLTSPDLDEKDSPLAEAGDSHAVALDVEDESAADAIMHDALEGSPIAAIHEGKEQQLHAAPPLDGEITGTSHSHPELNGLLLDPMGSGAGTGSGTGSASLSRQSSSNSILPPPQRPSRARGRAAGPAAGNASAT